MTLESEFKKLDIVQERMTESVIKKQLLPAYKQSLNEIRSKVALLYEKHAVGGVLSMSDATQYSRLINLEKDIADELKRLGVQNIKATDKLLKNVYTESYQRTAYGIENAVQQKLGFGLLPTKQVEAAIISPFGWDQAIQKSMGDTIYQIRNEIVSGITQGKSYGDVAKGIAERTGIAANRAKVIARTESHRARELGKLASTQHADKMGIIMKRRWLSAFDERTRSAHGAADGQEVGVDEPFNVGGEELDYPGDPAGSAENVINCRCTSLTIIPGFEPGQRRTREDDVIDYVDYKEYAEAKGWNTPYKRSEPRIPK